MLWKYSGFTLIEMLVVVSIIGILATLSLTSFTSVQKQARDTQRKSDIKQYQNALVSYTSKNSGFYLSSSDGTVDVTGYCATLGLTGCPEDPKYATNQKYKYQSNGTGGASGTKYVLWAKLESPATATYWVVCSNGEAKSLTSGIPPSTGTCP